MRPSLLLVTATLALTVQATWFGGDDSNTNNDNTKKGYENWNKAQLEAWLEVHHIPIPTASKTPSTADLRALVAENWGTFSAWTAEQYDSAQKAFTGVREGAFNEWDESRLRAWLVANGVVAPKKSSKDKLVSLAEARWREFGDAMSRAGGAASSVGVKATESAASAGASVTDTVSAAGAKVSKSASSVVGQVTGAVSRAEDEVAKAFDETKHYVYSSWDEGKMRAWLVEKGVLKSHEQKKKDELMKMMHDAWGYVANPVYEAWSTCYLHQWLVSHHIIKSDYEKNRDDLLNKMNSYYYSTKDSAWSTWTDSDMRQWLIDHGYMKSDAQASREKMIKMVEDNYLNARDTFWNAWSDNALRSWLTEHGYLRTDAQVKRDELIKLAEDKWTEERSRTQNYLTWPDARLRAYLREQGVEEKFLPGDRPGLLQETRIRWIMTENRAETLFQKIKDLVNSGMYKAEDALLRLVHLLGSGWEDTKDKAEDVKMRGEEGYEEAKRRGEGAWKETKHKAGAEAEWATHKAKGKKEEAAAKTAKAKANGEL